ncbi:MAG: hypothetical protein IKR49_10680 [Clostridia bacterium]|nr:hypothetical protein [Clostridia bacterium]
MKVQVKQERFQAANNVLRSIAAIDRRIEMLEKQIRRASLSGCPAEMRAQSYDGVPGGGGYRSDTMEIARQILALKQQLTEETQRRRAITDAIFALDAYSAELLERRYIRGEQTDEIAAALTDFDSRKFYRHLRDAVSSFAVQYYGGAAVEGVQGDL